MVFISCNMKYVIILANFLASLSLLNAQPNIDAKRPLNWIFGIGTPNNTAYQFSFPNNSLEISTVQSDLKFTGTGAYISDTLGNIIIYTNGVKIYNRHHEEMTPGTIISPGEYSSEAGYAYFQGAIILPYPGHPNLYYIMHIRAKPVDQAVHEAGICGDAFFYTLIDMNLNNGLGGVVEANHAIQTGFLDGMITATRHGNGRDWWIMINDCDEKRYYLWLLDNTGFHRQADQAFPGRYVGTFGQSKFSPDGTKFTFYRGYTGVPDVWLRLYDFDRCDGTLTETFALDTTCVYLGFGVEFSANSRYLYMGLLDYILQFDTEAPDILASVDTIAFHDGFLINNFWPTTFGCFSLMPDNKIYVSVLGSSTYMHVINSPDSEGLASNFVQRQISLPDWYDNTSPNFPNFRLGALTGSACDTLDFNVAVTPAPSRDNEASISALVYPNPSASNLTIAYVLPEQGEVSVVNALGQVMYEKVLAKGDDKLWLNVEDWANGVYFVRLSTPNSGVYSKKVFVLH